MSGKELVKRLKKAGWTEERISGSHHIMAKPGYRPVPIPVHGTKDLPKGLLSAILRQTDLEL